MAEHRCYVKYRQATLSWDDDIVVWPTRAELLCRGHNYGTS